MTRSARLVALVVAVVVILLVVAVYLWRRAAPEPVGEPETAATQPVRPLAEPTAAPPPPRRDVPPLEESDEAVRGWVAEVVDAPRLGRWLATPQVVRRFVAAVDDVARGESPRRHLRDLEPGRGLEVEEGLDRVVLDPASYRRYDAVADAVASLDTAAAVRLYEDLRPRLEEAYRDLGYPTGDFEATLLQAIDELLATPIPQGPVELEPRVRSYRFADPELEALAPAQKHLVRMGPENARKVKSKLRLLRQVLTSGLPPESLGE